MEVGSVAAGKQIVPKFNLNHPVPILILGDGPDLPNGLGRIGHDLAWLLSSMPEFKVGYLGRGSFGRSKFPWTSYSLPVAGQWGEEYVEMAWEDLRRGENGIIFTIWDASRLLWFTHNVEQKLADFMGRGSFERWGYFMADGAGASLTNLPLEQAEVMGRYRRVCIASKWAYALAKNSLPNHPDLDWLPHPINRAVFKPHEQMTKLYIRAQWGVAPNEKLVGCVMTNQGRKHWDTVIEAVAMLGDKVKFWLHTDRMLHDWNIGALLVEYGMSGRTIVGCRQMTDSELALAYCACDCTVLISGGEGFCYPVAESLSCGVPVVTGAYGAQAELSTFVKVAPTLTKLDTNHNVRRAYYDSEIVTAALRGVLDAKVNAEDVSRCVEHLDMPKLGVQWRKWFLRGLEEAAP